MAYVYRHIRLDKNEPFYIGIGTRNDNHARAYNTERRSEIWKRIFAKTQIDVEIIIDNISADKAKEKEVELIKLYGRINLKTGILVNMTDGGDGSTGYVPTIETTNKMSATKRANPKVHDDAYKKRMSERLKGRVHSEEHKAKIAKSHIGIKPDEATRKKLSDFHRGKTISEEHRKKTSDTLKGRKFSDETLKRMSIAASNRKIINGHWVKTTI